MYTRREGTTRRREGVRAREVESEPGEPDDEVEASPFHGRRSAMFLWLLSRSSRRAGVGAGIDEVANPRLSSRVCTMTASGRCRDLHGRRRARVSDRRRSSQREEGERAHFFVLEEDEEGREAELKSTSASTRSTRPRTLPMVELPRRARAHMTTR